MTDIGGVMVGGAIGILGSVVGPLFLQRLKDAADKKQKRREKCEELIGAVVEHYHWFAAMRYFFISGQGSQPTLSPITKIEAITGTYFPEFEGLLRQLDSASNDYEVWILDTAEISGHSRLKISKMSGIGQFPFGLDEDLTPVVRKIHGSAVLFHGRLQRWR
jgi:hypothetical protein